MREKAAYDEQKAQGEGGPETLLAQPLSCFGGCDVDDALGTYRQALRDVPQRKVSKHNCMA